MGQEALPVKSASPAILSFTPGTLGNLTEQLPAGVRHVGVSAVSVGVDVRTVISWLQLSIGQPPTGVFTIHNLAAIEELQPNDIVAGVVKVWRRRMKTLSTLEGDGQRWTNFINAAEKRSRRLNG